MVEFFKSGLLAKIQERRKVHENRLASGAIDKLAEYKLVVGRLQGLDEATAVINKTYQELINGSEQNERSKHKA